MHRQHSKDIFHDRGVPGEVEIQDKKREEEQFNADERLPRRVQIQIPVTAELWGNNDFVAPPIQATMVSATRPTMLPAIQNVPETASNKSVLLIFNAHSSVPKLKPERQQPALAREQSIRAKKPVKRFDDEFSGLGSHKPKLLLFACMMIPY